MTLDQLAAEPQRMASLSREERRALLMRAHALMTGLLIFEATDETNGALDRVLRLREAAARLGMAPNTLREKARKKPAFAALTVNGGSRVLRFSEQRVQQFIAKR